MIRVSITAAKPLKNGTVFLAFSVSVGEAVIDGNVTLTPNDEGVLAMAGDCFDAPMTLRNHDRFHGLPEDERLAVVREVRTVADGFGRRLSAGLMARARDDLGNNTPGKILAERLSLADAWDWVDDHGEDGTWEILEADGQPVCGYVLDIAGGASACDCGRPECPDHEGSAS